MLRTNYRNSIVTVMGLCALLTLPLAAGAADKAAPSIEALAEAAATTPAQHEALAAYYRDKAAAARADAEQHREMVLSMPAKGGASLMQGHCQTLVDAAVKAATAYEAMAAIHENEAKQAAK